MWVRVLRDRALLMLDVDDVRRVLEGSPDPFAADPAAKRKGMAHFQPDALTISRGELWAERRDFAEAVLDSPKPAHRLADRFVAVTAEEIRFVIDEVESGDDARARLGGLEPGLPADRAAHRARRRRAQRRGAERPARRADVAGQRPAGLALRAVRAVHGAARRHVARAEKGSLAGLFAKAPKSEDLRPAGQAVHWLFALGDTDAANALKGARGDLQPPRPARAAGRGAREAGREGLAS